MTKCPVPASPLPSIPTVPRYLVILYYEIHDIHVLSFLYIYCSILAPTCSHSTVPTSVSTHPTIIRFNLRGKYSTAYQCRSICGRQSYKAFLFLYATLECNSMVFGLLCAFDMNWRWAKWPFRDRDSLVDWSHLSETTASTRLILLRSWMLIYYICLVCLNRFSHLVLSGQKLTSLPRSKHCSSIQFWPRQLLIYMIRMNIFFFFRLCSALWWAAPPYPNTTHGAPSIWGGCAPANSRIANLFSLFPTWPYLQYLCIILEDAFGIQPKASLLLDEDEPRTLV